MPRFLVQVLLLSIFYFVCLAVSVFLTSPLFVRSRIVCPTNHGTV